jgi:uncharacterized RDD family membrane protein YckC
MPAAAFEPDYVGDDELVTGEAVALDLRPASFVLRSAGAAIDFALTVLIAVGLLQLLSIPGLEAAIDEALLAAIGIGLVVMLTIALPTTVETLTNGKSLGKLAIGARIVRDDGGAIGLRHAFVRALTGLLEIFLTLGGFAALVGLLNTRSKRLGDLLAGTYSQNERVRSIVSPTYGVPQQLERWATTADVARMPDRVSRRIAQFLAQAGGLTPDTRTRIARELQAEAAPFVSSVPDAHPEAFLLAIAAIRRERESAALELERQRLLRLQPVLSGRPHRFPERD